MSHWVIEHLFSAKAMSLLNTVLASIGITCVLWIAITVLPAIIQVCLGRATGIAIHCPRALQGMPVAWQLALTLLVFPLLVGSLAGCLWYFLSR